MIYKCKTSKTRLVSCLSIKRVTMVSGLLFLPICHLHICGVTSSNLVVNSFECFKVYYFLTWQCNGMGLFQ